MDVKAYYESLSAELEALKSRVRNFIDSNHWLTDGEWKESVLRSMIARRLPDSVKIGHGFIISEQGPSTQCDILLYRADRPVLFREGDLVFITPDAVLGIIEVKSRATRRVFINAIEKLAVIGENLGEYRRNCCLGFFAYEADRNVGQNLEWVLERLYENCPTHSHTINLVNLGHSGFIRYWQFDPLQEEDRLYHRWHGYELENMSAGYFIANILDFVSPGIMGRHGTLWFPENSKELFRQTRRSHPLAEN